MQFMCQRRGEYDSGLQIPPPIPGTLQESLGQQRDQTSQS